MTAATVTQAPLLETVGLSRRFGGLVAVNRVDFHLYPGERRCLIGPNGAGKTTFFNLITSVLEPSAGEILFGGLSITRRGIHEISRLGIARTFQVPNLFGNVTVLENMRIAAQRHRESFNPLRSARADRRVEELVAASLQRVGLLEQRDQYATSLSHGQKKQLELAMALACRPRLLLLDEPTAGMTLAETDEMVQVLKGLAGEVTILVVEHDIDFVRKIADRVTVFHRGSILTEGTLTEVESDPMVREIYLGQEKDKC